MEGPLLLALIGRCYDLRLAQDQVEPELMVTLRPKGGIRMTLEPRHTPIGSATQRQSSSRPGFVDEATLPRSTNH